MKRNDLLAKGLTLGLAVATAATSMTVPNGLLAPEAVYADEAGGTQSEDEQVADAAVSFKEDKHASGDTLTTDIKNKEEGTTYKYAWYKVDASTDVTENPSEDNLIQGESEESIELKDDYVGYKILVVVTKEGDDNSKKLEQHYLT